jgi:chromosome segregation ATPase
VQVHKLRDIEGSLNDRVYDLEKALDCMHGPRIDEMEQMARDRAEGDAHIMQQMEIQLAEMRANKLDLEDQLAICQDTESQLKSAVDMIQSENLTLKTELSLAKSQANGFKSDLLDSQVRHSSHSRRDASSESTRRKKRASTSQRSGEIDQQQLERISHLKAQITAQNMIIQTRENEIERLQNDVGTLSHELHDLMRELDVYRSGVKDPALLEYTLNSPGEIPSQQNQHISALKIQLSELSRQLAEKSTEAIALRRELNGNHHSHESAVTGLMEAWTKDQGDLKKSYAELNRKLQNAAKSNQQLQARINELEVELDEAHRKRIESERFAAQQVDLKSKENRALLEDAQRAKAIAKASNQEVLALQQEITDRVHKEERDRSVFQNLKYRVNSATANASDTASEVAFLEAKLAQHANELTDVEERWRKEVAARADLEEKHSKRIAELDRAVRKGAEQNRALQIQLKDKENQLDMLEQGRDMDAKAAEDTAERKWEAERTKTFEEYKRQLLTLDRSHSSARGALHECKRLIRERDEEITQLKEKMAHLAKERDENHLKLTNMLDQTKKSNLSLKEMQSSKIHELQLELSQLRYEHAEATGVIRMSPAKIAKTNREVRTFVL